MAQQPKLWSKGSDSAPFVQAYTAGKDALLDQELVSWDIYGSLAHVQMLQEQTLISAEVALQLQQGLKNILAQYEAGKFVLTSDDEDVHTRIEQELSKRFPEAGGYVHIGRSRNDQVATDLRLYSKQQIYETAQLVTQVAEEFLQFAQQHTQTPMPGYTHMQPAMLSSVDVWAAHFAESLLDDLIVLQAAHKLVDQSPLGSGAGYGVALPLNRARTAELLGFGKVQTNPLYCQNSRGKAEALVVHALSQVMLTLGRFAQDLLLFTTAEFDFFAVDESLTTGSSIMPQKRNLDVMELLRSRAKVVQSHAALLGSIVSSLPSGYNRDVQEMKAPFFESFVITQQSLQMVSLVLAGLTAKPDKMLQAITPPLFAAHHAYQIMQQQEISFREAYVFVGLHLDEIPAYSPQDVLSAMPILSLAELQKKVIASRVAWQSRHRRFQTHLENLKK